MRKRPRFGIVASGKAYEGRAGGACSSSASTRRRGGDRLRLFKVGMPWPLAPHGLRAFSGGSKRS